MKHSFTLGILMLVTAVSASAQPILTAATHMPVVGLRSQVFDKSAFLPGTAGANQTWDFSTQTFGSPKYGTWQACNTTNNCSAYPGTTIVYYWNTLYEYYIANGNTLSMNGFFNGAPHINSQPEDYLRFPMTYGNSFIDSFALWYSGGSGSRFRRGVDSVSADGWGTLKTPAGTFPNTLRIKNVSTFQDSLAFDPYDKTKGKIETYWFYDATHRGFLYTTASIVITPWMSSPQTATYARYTNNQSVAVEPLLNGGRAYRILQNPARGSVQVAINLDAAGEVSLSLTDMTGRSVRALPTQDVPAGESRLSLHTEGLPVGVYTLRITAGDEATALKVMIE